MSFLNYFFQVPVSQPSSILGRNVPEQLVTVPLVNPYMMTGGSGYGSMFSDFVE